MRRHLEESVHNLLEWEEGAWLYRPELAGSDERIVLMTGVERLIVDGVRRRYLIARMIKLLGPPSSLLVPSGVEFKPDQIGIDGKERALFKLLDGTRSIEDLVFSSGLSEERVYQLFTALEALGLLTVAVRGQTALEDNSENSDAIDRARIKERFELAKKADYFEFLSIPSSATEFDIERALAGARKLYAVERFAARVSNELTLELQEIERVLADAEYVLRDARLRDAYVQHLGRRIAQLNFLLQRLGMAIRKVVIWPNPILAAVAQPVKQVDARIKTLVRDLFDTMYDANGVGLAAPQVGVGECVVVVDLNPRGRKKKKDMDELAEQGFDGPRAFINAEIVHREGTLIWEEGCLSIPGINEEVERSEIITVQALDENGEKLEKTVSGSVRGRDPARARSFEGQSVRRLRLATPARDGEKENDPDSKGHGRLLP